MGQIATIPLHKLQQCPDNIRRSTAGEQADRELKASIETHGIYVSLIVKKLPRGFYKVSAGSRRLNALIALVAEKKIAKSYPVPCYLLNEDESAEEAALIENTLRAAMHPIDEYESFDRLHRVEKLTIDQIAAHFGKTVLDIKQRLALGAASPMLREQCRAGEISIDSLSAYTLIGSHSDQDAAFESLGNTHYRNSPWKIREVFAQNAGYKSDHKYVQFITLERYLAEGGTITDDLFEQVCYLHDTAIVDKLLKQKLEAASIDLSEAGWSWVDINLEHFYSPVSYPQRLPTPESKEVQEIRKALEKLQSKYSDLEELAYDRDSEPTPEEELATENEMHHLEAQINELEAKEQEAVNRIPYPTDQMKETGCVVTLDQDGQLVIEQGYYKKAERKKQGTPTETATNNESGPIELPPESASYSQKLLEDLERWHLISVKLDLAYNEETAYKLAQFTIAWRTLAENYFRSPLDISISDTTAGRSSDQEEARAKQSIEELLGLRKSLKLDWLDSDDVTRSWIAFRDLSDADTRKIIAWCASRALRSTQMITTIQEQIGTRISKYWRPTLDNFFSRCTLPMLLEIATEVYKDPDYADNHPTVKKKDLAAWLADEVEKLDPKEAWIPSMMRVPPLEKEAEEQ